MLAKSVIRPGALLWPVLRAGFPMWAQTGPLRFPGVPSRTFALLRDPGRTGQPGHSGFPSAAPGSNTAKASARPWFRGWSQGFSTRCLRFTS